MTHFSKNRTCIFLLALTFGVFVFLSELNRHSAGAASSDGGRLKGVCGEKSQEAAISPSHVPVAHTHILTPSPRLHHPPSLSLHALSVQEEAGWCFQMWLHTLDDSWLLGFLSLSCVFHWSLCVFPYKVDAKCFCKTHFIKHVFRRCWTKWTME